MFIHCRGLESQDAYPSRGSERTLVFVTHPSNSELLRGNEVMRRPCRSSLERTYPNPPSLGFEPETSCIRPSNPEAHTLNLNPSERPHKTVSL